MGTAMGAGFGGLYGYGCTRTFGTRSRPPDEARSVLRRGLSGSGFAGFADRRAQLGPPDDGRQQASRHGFGQLSGRAARRCSTPSARTARTSRHGSRPSWRTPRRTFGVDRAPTSAGDVHSSCCVVHRSPRRRMEQREVRKPVDKHPADLRRAIDRGDVLRRHHRVPCAQRFRSNLDQQGRNSLTPPKPDRVCSGLRDGEGLPARLEPGTLARQPRPDAAAPVERCTGRTSQGTPDR